jgi:uncharacterized cupin superfamily protein
MHTTATIDYDIMLSGEIWCELDDGVMVHLRAGDSLVQRVTRHAWCNGSSEPCVIASLLSGALT